MNCFINPLWGALVGGKLFTVYRMFPILFCNKGGLGPPDPAHFFAEYFFVKFPIVNPLLKSVSCVPPLGWGPFSENP